MCTLHFVLWYKMDLYLEREKPPLLRRHSGRTNIQTVTFTERQLRRQRLTGLLVVVRLDAANIRRLLAHQYVHQLSQRQFELCAGLQQQTHIISIHQLNVITTSIAAVHSIITI